MNSHSRSAKVILLLWVFFLTSCSGGDKAPGPSLNADDRWDWMAGERGKPLPVIEPDDASGAGESLPSQSSAPLSEKEINKLRAILGKADKEYYGIAASLDRDFRQQSEEAKETDRQALWRTMQLHLSRLINLQKYMIRAIQGLDSASGHEDRALLDHGRALVKDITARIARTRKYLDDFTPPE